MIIFAWYIPEAAPQFVWTQKPEKPPILFRHSWNPCHFYEGRNTDSTSGWLKEGRGVSRRGWYYESIIAPHSRTSVAILNRPCLIILDFGVLLAFLSEGRNTVFALRFNGINRLCLIYEQVGSWATIWFLRAMFVVYVKINYFSFFLSQSVQLRRYSELRIIRKYENKIFKKTQQ